MKMKCVVKLFLFSTSYIRLLLSLVTNLLLMYNSYISRYFLVSFIFTHKNITGRSFSYLRIMHVSLLSIYGETTGEYVINVV